MNGPVLSPFGALLRQWRGARHLSQLALALEADVSSRHLSYVETGRAQPSREMILRLAEALDVPLRERNALLLSAGYAPSYGETDLQAPGMDQARRAIGFLLKQHEPYPTVVMNRRWDVLMTNQGALDFFGLFPARPPAGAPNALRLFFHPEGLRPFVANWEEVAGHLVQRVHREAATQPDAGLRALLDELLSYPGIPARWHQPELDRPTAPLLPVVFRKDDLLLRFVSMITTFGTAQDVTLQELRIECSFPADEATDARWRQMAEGLRPGVADNTSGL